MATPSQSKIKPIHRAAVRRAATPADTKPELFNFFAKMFDEAVTERAQIIVDATVKKMQETGWKAPTPSRAYIAETHVRAVLGKRANSPMSPATFAAEYIPRGPFKRVPDTITGNRKTKFVYWADVEALISEKKADIIRRHIITG